MRIHYVVTSLESGGAEFSIPDIANVIRGLGHDFHVFACEPRDRMAEPRLIEAGVAYTLMAERKASKPASIYRYARAVRASPPDLIWTSLSHATLVGQVVGAMFGIPVVSWKHSADAKSYVRWLQRRSQLWIADSQDVAMYLRESMGVESARVATWPLFSPAFPDAPVSRWDGTGPLHVGSSGRLHPQKNYDLLIHALDRLRSEDPETYARIDVSIAGDGPLRHELQNLIASLGLQDKIKLMGWVSDVPAYLRGLHLYVQPSAYEGMCIAAHEAMAAGLPIVATPVGELRRSVQPGHTGMLLEGDIVTAIGTAIRQFVARPQTLEDYGENARSYVERTMGEGAFARNGRNVLERIESDVLKGRFGRPPPRTIDSAVH
ncbi:MAG TPA: glycosyltransferase [Luteibacter sp.]|uniref:glycosyltransferase n=1 Tax=Luteibacter sp. TaxID=1886636 RepID=UPI002CE6166E|nr:glycosyltransferase [Luteibacter sp.]HVI57047.1 glycosyltransferase [Luteibacter sp.]